VLILCLSLGESVFIREKSPIGVSRNSRTRRDGKADTSQPRIISEVGNNPTAMHEFEPPPDHKGVVTAITIVFAFIFAVAGVFIGVYFRVERVLKCIDRIGGSNSLDTEALIDDNKSIIGTDAMSQLQKQNETGFVHSCPAEAYPMKKQIYEKANKTPHTARRSIGPELPQADPLMIASPRQSRKREGSIAGDTISLASFKSESGRSIKSMFSARSLGAKSFGSMFSATSKDSKSSSALKNKINMYRRMRQERKKREDDDVHSVISEARSQRSMVIDGGSRGRHRGSRGQDEGAGSDAAGSNFGNRAQQIAPDLISLSSRKSSASRVSKVSHRSTTSTGSKKSRLSLKSIGSKKEKEPEKPQEFLNFGSYVAQGDEDVDQPNTKSDMLF